ncbi:MAG: 23S rRNA (guanosine(2251)-2'-O)-methyltransferase RlmB [Methanomicrobia archaeon]|nr:23S rRNA (guanosine(2251)-2'-O)-methyltransferase RlmB [Methanomicrobia archaeon]
MDMVLGRRAVMEVLKSSGKINKLLVAKNSKLEEILKIAHEKKILVSKVEKRVLDRFGEKHQGVIAFISPKEYKKFEDLRFSEDSFFIVLDRIKDPGNLGAIIRSCEFFNLDAVIIPKRNSAKITEIVWKSSAGALEHVNVVLVDNLSKTIEKLKEKKIWIIGADINGERCFEKNLRGPVALILGEEQKGMRDILKRKCDLLVEIPRRGNIESLNVSTAAGILIYEILRQRNFE